MTLLALDGLSVARGGRTTLLGATLAVGPGEVVGLVGPNGAGKTTLLRAALGLLPASGRSSLHALDPRARARAAAWLPQGREVAWPVAVAELVGLGRLPHLAPGERPGPADHAAVEGAMARMDLLALRDRPATRLSGGEQARALIARALAQEAPLLLADEPMAGLDPAHALALMGTFRDLAAEGRSVVASLHDLGLAMRGCTRLLVMAAGRVVADAPPEAALTPERARDVFGVVAARARTEQGLLWQAVGRA